MNASDLIQQIQFYVNAYGDKPVSKLTPMADGTNKVLPVARVVPTADGFYIDSGDE